jgi:hypothetical protein
MEDPFGYLLFGVKYVLCIAAISLGLVYSKRTRKMALFVLGVIFLAIALIWIRKIYL